MNTQTVLAHRRDAVPHTREEIEFLVRGATDGSIADYQLSAWLMAAVLNPLGPQETAWLTMAMARSGQTLDLVGLPKPWVDKHSTGGVGDKTSLVLLPLLASCGLTVVKMSGRGLGITGGTVDKLSSVPGFRIDLSPSDMVAQAARIGIALTGQTPDLAPADKVLYALRDATETVESLPLIVSSILSKKLAGGAEIVVLDVKCGSGAFMKTREAANDLAAALRETAALCGLKVRTAISDMDQPLGRMIGNAMEVREALAVLSEASWDASAVRSEETLLRLQGESRPSPRFRDLCLDLAALTLAAAGLAPDEAAGLEKAEHALKSGAALAKAREWFAAQGAGPDAVDHPERLPVAPVHATYTAQEDGYVVRIDARIVGETVISLGGGRRRKEDQIDPSVGIELHCEVGSHLAAGDRLFTVHAASEASAKQAREALLAAIALSPDAVPSTPALLESPRLPRS